MNLRNIPDSTKSTPLNAGKAKAKRGYERIGSGNRPFEKATSVEVDSTMSCARAFGLIAGGCLKQIIANEPGMLTGHAEALHQFRVGLRRLRAAIKAFAEMTADSQQNAIKSELKWVMKQVGPARDLDVFGTSVLEPLEQSYDPQLAAARRSYNEMRNRADRTVKNSIRSGRFRKFLRDLAEWAEGGRWATDPALKKVREQRIRKHAGKVLDFWHQSFHKRCRKLGDLSAKQRHRLRMRAKDLRYATEFFASLFPTHVKRREATLAALENLQDTLGALNDLTARKGIMPKEIKQSAHARKVIAAQERKSEKLLEEAKSACVKLGEVKAFWN